MLLNESPSWRRASGAAGGAGLQYAGETLVLQVSTKTASKALSIYETAPGASRRAVFRPGHHQAASRGRTPRRNPAVAAEIDAALAERARVAGITAERVLFAEFRGYGIPLKQGE